jgi:Tfp pilus assembly protein PilO
MAASDWSEKTRMMVTIGVSVLLNGALGYFLYSAYAENADLAKKITGKLKDKQELKKKVDEEGDVQRELDKKNADFATKKNRLPEVDPVEELFRAIDKISTETGARLINQQIVPGEEIAPGTSYQKTTLRTVWVADEAAFCKVLHKMEDNRGFDRFVSFENLTITPKNQGLVPHETPHTINVDIITYKYVAAP